MDIYARSHSATDYEPRPQGIQSPDTPFNSSAFSIQKAYPLQSTSYVTDLKNLGSSYAAGYYAHKIFITPPLFAQDIPAGTWSSVFLYSYYIQDLVIPDPVIYPRLYAYVWQADDTKGADIIAPVDGINSIPAYPGYSDILAGDNAGAVTIAEGDRIAFEVYYRIATPPGGGIKMTINLRYQYYDDSVEPPVIGGLFETPADFKASDFIYRVIDSTLESATLTKVAPDTFKAPGGFAVPDAFTAIKY